MWYYLVSIKICQLPGSTRMKIGRLRSGSVLYLPIVLLKSSENRKSFIVVNGLEPSRYIIGKETVKKKRSAIYIFFNLKVINENKLLFLMNWFNWRLFNNLFRDIFWNFFSFRDTFKFSGIFETLLQVSQSIHRKEISPGRAHGVEVIAILHKADKKYFVFVKEYRIPPAGYCFEFPAGNAAYRWVYLYVLMPTHMCPYKVYYWGEDWVKEDSEAGEDLPGWEKCEKVFLSVFCSGWVGGGEGEGAGTIWEYFSLLGIKKLCAVINIPPRSPSSPPPISKTLTVVLYGTRQIFISVNSSLQILRSGCSCWIFLSLCHKFWGRQILRAIGGGWNSNRCGETWTERGDRLYCI